MADWIDQLQKKEEPQQECARIRAQTQLHDATIIKAKAHAIWRATIEHIRADCEKLRRTFPADKRRHCHSNESDVGVTMVNEGPLPRMELYVGFNADGQCVDLIERQKIDRFQPAQERHSGRIEITVNEHEEVEFQHQGKVHTTPEDLAQAMLSRVCGIASA